MDGSKNDRSYCSELSLHYEQNSSFSFLQYSHIKLYEAQVTL